MKKVYIIAAITAVAVALFGYLFLSSFTDSKKASKDTINVPVALVNIEPGTTVTDDMFEMRPVAKSAVLTTAYVDNSCSGKMVDSKIFAGEQITTDRVVERDQLSYNHLSFKLEEGHRAISFAVSDTTDVSGFIRNGDFVDILYTVQGNPNTTNGMHAASTEVLFENVKVIAVGNYITNQSGQEAEYGTITFDMLTEDSMKFTSYLYSIESGSANGGIGGRLSLVLRSPDEKTSSKNKIVNAN